MLRLGADLSLGQGGVGSAAAVPVFDFTAGVLPAGATLTRASAALRWDAGGMLVSEASNAARFDHDPVSQTLVGLLIEPQRTNSLIRSAEFDAGTWTKNAGGIAAIAVAANAGTAPDGSATADRLDLPAFNSANADHYSLAQQTVSLTASRAISIWLRGAAGGEKVTFNGYVGGTYEPTSPAVLTLTGGWQRYSLVSAVAGSSVALFLGHNGYNGAAYSAAAASIYAWGAQIESGASVTSHVPTTNAAATRSADVLMLDWGSKGVADGAITVRYTFGDLSTQDIAATVAGGVATVPTNLSRAHIRRAEKI